MKNNKLIKEDINKIKITYKIKPDYIEGTIYINGKFALDITENEINELKKMYTFDEVKTNIFEYEGLSTVILSIQVGHLWFNNLYYIEIGDLEVKRITKFIN